MKYVSAPATVESVNERIRIESAYQCQCKGTLVSHVVRARVEGIVVIIATLCRSCDRKFARRYRSAYVVLERKTDNGDWYRVAQPRKVL